MTTLITFMRELVNFMIIVTNFMIIVTKSIPGVTKTAITVGNFVNIVTEHMYMPIATNFKIIVADS